MTRIRGSNLLPPGIMDHDEDDTNSYSLIKVMLLEVMVPGDKSSNLQQKGSSEIVGLIENWKL